MVFGNDITQYTFWLGNETIPIVKKVKHLGTCVTENEKCMKEFIHEKIYKGRQTVMSVQGLGSNTIPLSIKAQSKIYWSVALPQITYGFEVMSLKDDMLESLENAHHNIAKKIQRLPDSVPSPCVLKMIGWRTMKYVIDVIKLMFLWNLLSLDGNCIYNLVTKLKIRKWFEDPDKQTGPISSMMNTANQYMLHDVVQNALSFNQFYSKSEWKKRVKENASIYEYRMYNLTISMYKSLKIFEKCFSETRLWPWWQHASKYPCKYRKCQIMARLIACDYFIKDEGCFKSGKCSYCDQDFNYDICHILFVCEKYSESRKNEWETVKCNIPPALATELENMTPREKTCFIFSGFRSKYIPEFTCVYDTVLDYVCKMYEIKKGV